MLQKKLPKTRYTNSYNDFIDSLTSINTKVLAAICVGYDMMCLHYEKIYGVADSAQKCNIYWPDLQKFLQAQFSLGKRSN